MTISGLPAKLIVDVRGPGIVALSWSASGKYLNIRNDKVNLQGNGDKYCNFYVHDLGKKIKLATFMIKFDTSIY